MDKKAEKIAVNTQKSFLERELERLEGQQATDTTQQSIEDGLKQEIDEKLKKFKDDFDSEKNACQEKAKNLLSEVAKFYFNDNIIDKNEYVKFRSELDAMSLGNMIFQLNTAHRAIFKLSEQIHMGTMNSRIFEVLTGLQRVVLDISKFQHEYVRNIEESFKSLKMDLMETSGDTPDADNGIALKTNSKKKLLDVVTSYLSEIQTINHSLSGGTKKEVEYQEYQEVQPDNSPMDLEGFV